MEYFCMHQRKNTKLKKTLNKHFEAVFNLSSDGVWICDSTGYVLNINKASEEMNSLIAKDRIGRNVKELVEKGYLDKSVTLEVLKTKKKVSMLQYVKRSNKTLLLTGNPVFDPEGNVDFVIINERDMTYLNSLQEQLKKERMEVDGYKQELAALSLLELQQEGMIAESEKMKKVLNVSLRLSHFDASGILLLGESGVGKGLLAKFIHKNSKRVEKPFIQINCAALPENLLEAELFGYEKGAFTGARSEGKMGLFELAEGGTLFLDEIGDMPYSLQGKLLKYLDDKNIRRLGSVKSRQVDCLIIAATNRDLTKFQKNEKFRNDLFYRLNAFTVNIPPLRERYEDLFEMTYQFLDYYNELYKQKKEITLKLFNHIKSYNFPGNVRELRNIIKQAVVLTPEQCLDDTIIKSLHRENIDFQSSKISGGKNNMFDEIKLFERNIIKEAMKNCRTTREIADYLGICQASVVRKIDKHNLSKRNKKT